MWYSQIRDIVIKLGLCMLPLLLTIIIAALIADGFTSDANGALRYLIPWLLWSLIYTVTFVILWLMRFPLERSLAYSAGGSTLLISMVWIMMAIWFAGNTSYSVL